MNANRRPAQELRASRAGRGGGGERAAAAVRPLVPRGAGREAAGTQRDDAGDRRRRRPAVDADRPDQGLRRARLRLVHELPQPQGARARRQSAGRAAVPLGGAGARGAHRGRGGQGQRRGVGRLLRDPAARFADRRLGVAAERGHPDPGGAGGQRRALRGAVPAAPAAARALGRVPAAARLFEFWQGRRSRLHDRLRYVRDGEQWRRERLAP